MNTSSNITYKKLNSNRNSLFKKTGIWKAILWVSLLLYGLFAIFPIFWLFYNSLKTNNSFLAHPFALPGISKLVWSNYYESWVTMHIGTYTLNSLYIAVLSVGGGVIIAAMAAFAIKRMIWKLSRTALTYFLLGIFVPAQATLIPLFLNFRDMGLSNTRNTLILPYIAFALPTTIYILCGFYESIPRELEESCVIDGCSVYRIFWNIILPLSKPAFITVIVLNFLGAWNELLMALVLVTNSELMTLPVGLLSFMGQFGSQLTKMFSAVIISILPSLLIYFLLQDKITKGMYSGAIKG